MFNESVGNMYTTFRATRVATNLGGRLNFILVGDRDRAIHLFCVAMHLASSAWFPREGGHLAGIRQSSFPRF